MKDEIKEKLKNSLEYEFELSFNDRKQLLDYITNLQEENERLKKLKERYQLKKEIYKSRNEKAIEYIKEDMYGEPNELYGLVDGEHLLNILQSSDNNSK